MSSRRQHGRVKLILMMRLSRTRLVYQKSPSFLNPHRGTSGLRSVTLGEPPPPTRHALRTPVTPQWVSRRSDFHQIVATVARFFGRSRFVTTSNRSIRNCAFRRWAPSPPTVLAVSLSAGDGEPTTHYAVRKPFSSNADDVLASDRRLSCRDQLRPFFLSLALLFLTCPGGPPCG
jgi:hypothetical protein